MYSAPERLLDTYYRQYQDELPEGLPFDQFANDILAQDPDVLEDMASYLYEDMYAFDTPREEFDEGFGLNEWRDEQPSWLEVVGDRTAKRVTDLAAGGLTAFDTAARWLEEKVPLGGISLEEGYISPDELRDRGGADAVRDVAKKLRGVEFTYSDEERVSWDEFKESPVTQFIPFALENGLVSVPDMITAMASLPLYVGMRTGEIGSERAENDKRDEATAGDLLAALPAAVVSGTLERFAASRVFGLDPAAAKQAIKEIATKKGAAEIAKGTGKEIAKRAAIEGATESIQEPVEQTGAAAFTERWKNMSAGEIALELGESAAQGGVVGLGFGGAVGAGAVGAQTAMERRRQMGVEDAPPLDQGGGPTAPTAPTPPPASQQLPENEIPAPEGMAQSELEDEPPVQSMVLAEEAKLGKRRELRATDVAVGDRVTVDPPGAGIPVDGVVQHADQNFVRITDEAGEPLAVLRHDQPQESDPTLYTRPASAEEQAQEQKVQEEDTARQGAAQEMARLIKRLFDDPTDKNALQALTKLRNGKEFDALSSEHKNNLDDLLERWRRENEAPATEATPDETGAIIDPETGERLSMETREFTPDELNVDAERFQFKSGGDQFGVTGRLSDVKELNRAALGRLMVWQDNDGQYWVVDGHQRSALARRIQAENPDQRITLPATVLRESDGVTEREARILAAKRNVLENNASVIDMAKLERDEPGALDQNQTSGTQTGVRQARSIAKLGDNAFSQAINELLPTNYLALVGEMIPQIDGQPDDALQTSVITLLREANPANEVEARAMIHDILSGPINRETQTDLLGDFDLAQSLLRERAKIWSWAVKKVRESRSLLRTLTERAGAIENIGENVLDQETNRQELQQVEVLLQFLQKSLQHKGPVSEALDEAARKFKNGEQIGKAGQVFFNALKQDIEGTMGAGTAEGADAGALELGGGDPETGSGVGGAPEGTSGVNLFGETEPEPEPEPGPDGSGLFDRPAAPQAPQDQDDDGPDDSDGGAPAITDDGKFHAAMPDGTLHGKEALSFNTNVELTEHLQEEASKRLESRGWTVRLSGSNISLSRYMEVNGSENADGEVESVKVRFSDHPDRYGSDISFDIDGQGEPLYGFYDDDGNIHWLTYVDMNEAGLPEGEAENQVRMKLSDIESFINKVEREVEKAIGSPPDGSTDSISASFGSPDDQQTAPESEGGLRFWASDMGRFEVSVDEDSPPIGGLDRVRNEQGADEFRPDAALREYLNLPDESFPSAGEARAAILAAYDKRLSEQQEESSDAGTLTFSGNLKEGWSAEYRGKAVTLMPNWLSPEKEGPADHYLLTIDDRSVGALLHGEDGYRGDSRLNAILGGPIKKGKPLVETILDIQAAVKKRIDAELAAAAEPEKSKIRQLAEYLLFWAMSPKQKRRGGMTNPDLFAMAAEVYGGTSGDGAFDAQDAYNAVEMAMNLQVLKVGPVAERFPLGNLSAFKGLQAWTNNLRALLANMPTQTRRTRDKTKYQQFSTPPDYAAAVVYAADIKEGDNVLEPSAGTGSLAVHMGGNVHANELDPRRAEILRDLGFKDVTEENAEHISNIFDAESYDVVVMNPPFSSAGDRGGANTSQVGSMHVWEAVKLLKPGGRLVAIVGETFTPDNSRVAEFFTNLEREGQIHAFVKVNGNKVYRKLGTSFDNQVIVFDKTGAQNDPNNTVIGEADDIPALLDLLSKVPKREKIEEESQGKPAASTRPKPATTPEEDKQIEDLLKVPDFLKKPGRGGTPAPDPAPEPTPAPAPTPAPETTAEPTITYSKVVTNEFGDKRVIVYADGQEIGEIYKETEMTEWAADAAVRAYAGEEESDIYGSTLKEAKADLMRALKAKKTAAEPETEDQEEFTPTVTPPPSVDIENLEQEAAAETEGDSNVYAASNPGVTVQGAKPHPTKLVESLAQALIKAPKVVASLVLPQSLIEDGTLSSAQIEAVARANASHEIQNPDGTRRGFFVGDGTGVGKGREIAGIIRDNWLRGRKTAIWFTEKRDLIIDSTRDLKDIGYEGVIHDATTRVGMLKGFDGTSKEGTYVTTYSQLKTPYTKQEVAERQRQALEGDRQSDHTQSEDFEKFPHIGRIVDTLGEDFDGVIVFDEAHAMANAVTTKKSGRTTQASLTAQAGMELAERLPNARVVYVSATGATEVSNLGYLDRLGLWGEGTAFAEKRDFLAKIAAGGTAAMELVAQDMKALGRYLARSISFEGVEYDNLTHELTEQQIQIYNTAAEAWRILHAEIEEAISVMMPGAKKTDRSKAQGESQFWGAHQRFFNQLLTSLQLPTVLKKIEQDLEDGLAPVIQMVNTNEAATKRALDKQGEQDLEQLDISPQRIVTEAVNEIYPIFVMRKVTDAQGKETWVVAKDRQGNPIVDKVLLAKRENLLRRMAAMQFPDDPLTQILDHFGVENVAEVTGRSERIVRVDGEKTRLRRKPGQGAQETREFMQGKRKILLFSMAGGTGMSYHNSRKNPVNKRRSHYILQAGWQASRAVQGFGRTHRSDQHDAPIFRLVQTDIPAHKRFVATIARRLDQLGALTKGQTTASGAGMFSALDNLENKYARMALDSLLADVLRSEGPISQVDVEKQMGIDLTTPTGQRRFGAVEIKRFLNRLFALDFDKQKVVFEDFINRMGQNIEAAIAEGTFDTGVEEVKALSATLKKEKKIFTEEESGTDTFYREIDLTKETRYITTEMVERELQVPISNEGVWKNNATGKVYYVYDLATQTDERGDLFQRVAMRTPDSGYRIMETDKFKEEHSKIKKKEEALSAWEKAVAATPETYNETIHMISGALLPVYNRIKSKQVRVQRVTMDDGLSFLGRVLTPFEMSKTLANFNLKAEFQTITAPTMMSNVLEQDLKFHLSNGAEIKKTMLSGEARIEVIPSREDSFTQLEEGGVFDNLGFQIENINWQSHAFVPNNAGGENALARYLRGNDVVRVTGATNDHDMSSRINYRADQRSIELINGADAAVVNQEMREIVAGLVMGVTIGTAQADSIPLGNTAAGYRADAGGNVQVTDIGAIEKALGVDDTLRARPKPKPGSKSEQLEQLDELRERLAPFVDLRALPTSRTFRNVRTGRVFSSSASFDVKVATKNAGESWNLSGPLITVALDSTPLSSLRHEAIHALRAFGLFTEAEWTALRMRAEREDWIERHDIRRLYPELFTASGKPRDKAYEEAIAFEFPVWVERKKKNPKAKPESMVEDRLFTRIFQFFRELVAKLRGHGATPRADNVFEDIESGVIGARTPINNVDYETALKIVGQADQRTGPRRRADRMKSTQHSRERLHEFADEKVEKRYRAARLDPPKLLDKIKDVSSDQWNRLTRYRRRIETHPVNADIIEKMIHLDQAGVAARQTIHKLFTQVMGGLKPNQIDLMTRKMVLDDLLWTAGQGMDLPFGLQGEEQVFEELKEVERILEQHPDLQRRLDVRNHARRKLATDLVKAGILTPRQIQNPHYFRHQVLDYAKVKASISGRKVHESYWHSREGSEKDINTNYFEAEADWMFKAHTDIATAKFLNWLRGSQYNAAPDLVRAAKSENAKNLQEAVEADKLLAAKLADIGQSIAISLSMLRRSLSHIGVERLRDQIPVHLRGQLNAFAHGGGQQSAQDDSARAPIFGLLSFFADSPEIGLDREAQIVFSAILARRKVIRDALGDKYVDPRNVEGLIARYTKQGDFMAWQPNSYDGKTRAIHIYTTDTLAQHVVARSLANLRTLLAGSGIRAKDLDAIEEMMNEAKQMRVIGGPQEQLAISTPIAETLNEFRDAPITSALDKLAVTLTGRWKQWILFNPGRFIKYYLNNLTGDIDALVATPAGRRIVGKQLAPAFRAVRQMIYGGEINDTLQEAIDRGVVHSSITNLEVESLGPLADDAFRLSQAKGVVKAAGVYFEHVMNFANLRENAFRYAAYLHYKQEFESGKKLEDIGFGAARPEMVRGMTDPLDRAAYMARQLLGDYPGIPEAARWARRRVLPFVSWIASNTIRYNNLFRNVYLTYRTVSRRRGLAAGAGSAAGLTLSLFSFYAAVQLYNNLLFGDDEEKRSVEDRARLHLNMGEWAGQLVSLRFQGALSDYLEWFGAAKGAEIAYEVYQGRDRPLEIVKKIVQSPVNKITSAISPIWKLPVETTLRINTWPDAFNPRHVRDRTRHVASSLGLERPVAEVQKMMGTPSATLSPSKSIAGAVLEFRDPGKIAYDNMRSMGYRYLETTTGRRMRGSGGADSNLIYQWAQATKSGDDKTVRLAKDIARSPETRRRRRQENLPPIKESLEASVRRGRPWGMLSEVQKKALRRTLTPNEKQMLRAAQNWYKSTTRRIR